jgi:hypothetical protein
MELAQEISQEGYGNLNSAPTLYCCIFEVNSGAFDMATSAKLLKLQSNNTCIDKVLDGTLEIKRKCRLTFSQKILVMLSIFNCKSAVDTANL